MQLNQYPKVILIMMCMLLLTNSILYAQRDTVHSNPNFGWLNFGIGVSSLVKTGGEAFSYGAVFSYCFKTNLISVRYIANSEFNLLGPTPDESVWDLGVLFGISTKAWYGVASLSGGIAIVGGVHRGRYLGSTGWFSSIHEKHVFHTIGFPVEAQLFWTPISFIGFGIYGFANINTEQSFAGALLCLQVGKFR